MEPDNLAKFLAGQDCDLDDARKEVSQLLAVAEWIIPLVRALAVAAEREGERVVEIPWRNEYGHQYAAGYRNAMVRVASGLSHVFNGLIVRGAKNDPLR